MCRRLFATDEATAAAAALSQVRPVVQPYRRAMNTLRLPPDLMFAIGQHPPPGLNEALEAARSAALHLLPQETLSVLVGEADAPTTALESAGVRFPLAGLLAPVLASALSGAARQRVSVPVAFAILFGDDMALDNLDM